MMSVLQSSRVLTLGDFELVWPIAVLAVMLLPLIGHPVLINGKAGASFLILNALGCCIKWFWNSLAPVNQQQVCMKQSDPYFSCICFMESCMVSKLEYTNANFQLKEGSGYLGTAVPRSKFRCLDNRYAVGKLICCTAGPS